MRHNTDNPRKTLHIFQTNVWERKLFPQEKLSKKTKTKILASEMHFQKGIKISVHPEQQATIFLENHL